jgi:MFS family permease
VFLLTGAALGDRFGRKRMFSLGLGIFTVASAAAALAPSMGALIAARAVQGVGGALVMPLTLTLLSAAFPAERRGVALGIWGAIGGIAVASGPLVGGAVIEGISWQWIFWLNVPSGSCSSRWRSHAPREPRPGQGARPARPRPCQRRSARRRLGSRQRQRRRLDEPGDRRVAQRRRALLVAFVMWELRTREPMLPMRFFRNRASRPRTRRRSRCRSGCSARSSCSRSSSRRRRATRRSRRSARAAVDGDADGRRPIAGALSDKIGSRPILAVGLALQAIGLAWIAAVSSATVGVRVARRPVHRVGHRHGDVSSPRWRT